MVIGADDIIRFHALIHIVIRAVDHEGEAQRPGDSKGGSPCGGHGKDRAAAATGFAAKQFDIAVHLESPRNQVAAGEGDRGDQAVKVQPAPRQRILFVKLPVQVDIRPENRGCFRSAEGILNGQLGVPEEPAQHIDRRGSMAADIAAQVQHDVFDRAVFPGDLPVRLDDLGAGIERGGVRFRSAVIVRLGILKVVQRDISGVSHLMIAGDSGEASRHGGILLAEGGKLFPHGLEGSVGIAPADFGGWRFRQERVSVVRRMAVVQPQPHHVADRLVRFGGAIFVITDDSTVFRFNRDFCFSANAWINQ